MKKFLIVFFVALFFVSCNLIKNFGKKKKVLTVRTLIDSVNNRSTPVYSYEAKYSTVFNSSRIYGQIKADTERFYLSASLLVTIFKLYANKDSVFIYVPMANSLYKASTAGNSLFSVLKNNDFLFGRVFSLLDTVPAYKFNLSSDSLYILDYRIPNPSFKKYSLYYQRITIDKDFFVRSVYFADYLNYTELYLFYNSYDKIKTSQKTYFLPKKIRILYVSKDTTVLNLNFKSIKINEPLKIKFKKPQNAKVIDFDILDYIYR